MTDKNKKIVMRPNVSPNLNPDKERTLTVIRMRFSRTGSLAYIAHLDTLRLFERTLRRANINCDYTQGFNPRPVMSFALPSGVGTISYDDYMDITVLGRGDPERIMCLMNESLPEGIKILNAFIPEDTSKSIMSRVIACEYLFELEGIGKGAYEIEAAKKLPVEKYSKGRKTLIDAKEYIVCVDKKTENSIVATLKAGSQANLRPDLFLDSVSGLNSFKGKDLKNTVITKIKTVFSQSEEK